MLLVLSCRERTSNKESIPGIWVPQLRSCCPRAMIFAVLTPHFLTYSLIKKNNSSFWVQSSCLYKLRLGKTNHYLQASDVLMKHVRNVGGAPSRPPATPLTPWRYLKFGYWAHGQHDIMPFVEQLLWSRKWVENLWGSFWAFSWYEEELSICNLPQSRRWWPHGYRLSICLPSESLCTNKLLL